ncbi:efflux RND transporter periplasmic adaptor subunit [Corallincola holothuriorum]|uniref:Efflux RND transporter periplasmic adaptor subunit n=1 Tax=Corallincola holothuriorum TaxID=2282215 RepID=A0A368NMC1_9GAMM|nr:efflux RND transporter periplasmic adaptor subunit [Corallincola holothuriorum]RCU51707.1 efflux RND transporter periplasmic adaptor subunit [Corallincola holothuriorum]
MGSTPPLILALLLAISVPTLNGCLPSVADETATSYRHKVQAYPIKLAPHYQVPRQFVGLVSNNQEARVGFELAGKIASIEVNEGDRVKAGDLLAQLDTQLLKINRQELQAQLNEIDAEMLLIDSNLKRVEALVPKGYASTQSLEELHTQRNALAARRTRLQASLSANQSRLDKAQLLAPFDAIVNKRMISEGEVVAAGLATFELLQQGTLEVKVGVPVRLLELLAQKQPTLRVGEQTFTATLLTQGGQVDPVSRTVQLRYALPADASVVNGQLAYLQLKETIEKQGCWIPLTALTDGIRGMWNVYLLVTDDHQVYRLEKRDVAVLYANETHAFVSGAVTDQDLIVAAGLHRLAPGQNVELTAQVTETAQ